MKTKLYYYLLFFLTIISLNKSTAQSKLSGTDIKSSYTNSYFGFGIGLDYGAFGIKGEFLPSKYIGIFVGAGYALIDAAFNAGVCAKLLPDKKFCPTVSAMYGYNAVIYVKRSYGVDFAKSKVYYGPSVGAGGELKFGKKNSNKLTFGIVLPFRNPGFHNDYDNLKASGYRFDPDILPVAFSFGVNFGLGTKTD